MFVSTCSGCIQVPTPVYYWNPYTTSAVFPKKSPFQISEILQMTQNATKQRTDNSSEKIEYPFSTNTIRKYDSYLRRHADQDFHKKIPGSTTELRGIATHVAGDTNEVINYSKKVDGAKCSLPSALEPLQALCSAGLRGYGSTSPSEGQISKDHSISISSSPKNLKFGIHRILGEDFGNKTDKENAPTSNNEHRSSSGAQRPCECTYEGCQVYQQMRFPSHALSAVHALQPPRYPTSPSGTDVLPGPYSVLNTDVHIGAHAKRKRSWSRAVFSNLQRKGLEKRFEVQKYVTKPDRRQLAAMLGLTDAQVKVWFQNRRMKWRHAQQQNDEDENDTHPADDNSPELDANSKMLVGDILEDVELVIDETEDIDDLSEVEEHDISDTSERHNTRMDVDTRDQTVTCASTSE